MTSILSIETVIAEFERQFHEGHYGTLEARYKSVTDFIREAFTTHNKALIDILEKARNRYLVGGVMTRTGRYKRTTHAQVIKDFDQVIAEINKTI